MLSYHGLNLVISVYFSVYLIFLQHMTYQDDSLGGKISGLGTDPSLGVKGTCVVQWDHRCSPPSGSPPALSSWSSALFHLSAWMFSSCDLKSSSSLSTTLFLETLFSPVALGSTWRFRWEAGAKCSELWGGGTWWGPSDPSSNPSTLEMRMFAPCLRVWGGRLSPEGLLIRFWGRSGGPPYTGYFSHPSAWNFQSTNVNILGSMS